MSDKPKIWPPPPEQPSPAPEGVQTRWNRLSPGRRAAIIGIAVLLVLVFVVRAGDDDDGDTDAATRSPSPTVGVDGTSDPTSFALPGATGPPAEGDRPAAADAPLSAEEQERRRNSAVACDRFDQFAGDIPEGDELRNRLQEVNDAAGTAPQAVQDSARAMLDAVNNQDGNGFLKAGSQMATACRQAGH